MVIGAIGPEAGVDPPRFRRAIVAALKRLAAVGADGEEVYGG